MDTPDYQLTIRARPEGGFNPDVEMLDSRLGRIPGVTITGSGSYRFGEPDEHGVMEFSVPATGEISIRIPRPWVMERGPQVFALVFMTAEWCGGEVHDPQIDDTLQKETVLQGMVAVRQAQKEQELKSAPQAPTPTSDTAAPPKRPWWKKG